MTGPAVAAVDWGTSSFRLWLLDASGAVLAEKRSGDGMLTAGAEGFPAILERHLAAAGAPADLPVIVCGMAGARQGWIEAPYVALPASLDAILAGAVPVPGQARKIRILPGLAQRSAEAPDVMRGEETQLAGVLPLFAAGSHLICMPGTHSKWVEAADGVITGFRTWLTGELFSILSKQSILRHSLGDKPAARPARQPDVPQRLRPGARRRRRHRLQPVPHPRRDPAPGPSARRCGRDALRPPDRRRDRLGPPRLRLVRRQGHPRRVRSARFALLRRAEACRLGRAPGRRRRSRPRRPVRSRQAPRLG